MMTHPNRNQAERKLETAVAIAHNHDHDYSALLVSTRDSFNSWTAGRTRLFQTDVTGLNDLYLDSLSSERQVHNCHACRRFIETYGSLVAIETNGALVPIMWSPDDTPDFYRTMFTTLRDRVKRARVTSAFYSPLRIWGTPVTEIWSHLAVTPPAALIYSSGALTSHQAMAASRESFKTISTALPQLKPKILDETIRVLKADVLSRSDRFIAPVQWLRDLHKQPKGRTGENLLWLATATAPEGYLHPRASVVGTLIEDIESGLSFDDVRARFEAKIHPLQYQRPQAAPSAGNVKAAEALVEKLGIARSLERRFARLDELQASWWPSRVEPEATIQSGVFGHLKTKDATATPSLDLPPAIVTWEKFAREVLPSSERLELLVPAHGNFLAFTSAVHADAPPILLWDQEDERNPIGWYVYHNGSPATRWGLRGGARIEVMAVVPSPTIWGSRPQPHLGLITTVLILRGAVDTDNRTSALFPEGLRGELYGARSTIEAYSKSRQLANREEASACGIALSTKNPIGLTLFAYSADSWRCYHIDRFD